MTTDIITEQITWFPAKDMFPISYTEVLIYETDNELVTTGFYNGEIWIDNEEAETNVVFWAFMPPHPILLTEKINH